MHVYFSGIGGMGIGPMSLIALKAGYRVSGSDKQNSHYLEYLRRRGLPNIQVGQSYEQIAKVHKNDPIDWFVFSSAVAKEHTSPPELHFCQEHNIRTSKRDEFLSEFLSDRSLKLVAVAGTHGKTTTTAMTIWLFKQLGMPISYSVGAKMSFGDMGAFDPSSDYFVYEADEYDQNFLAFSPYLSLITGIDWDHPDVYPTREQYVAAFRQFLNQSRRAWLWDADMARLGLSSDDKYSQIKEADPAINSSLHLPGLVNRQKAWQVAHALQNLTDRPLNELLTHMDRFPGISRRFEQIAPHIYSDYAHTPPKIRGALQMAQEVAGRGVVVVYEGLHNTRQHFIKSELYDLFEGVKKLYVVPSYLAREDQNLALLSPSDLINLLSQDSQHRAVPAQLDNNLANKIRQHAKVKDTVVCLSAGGGNSLDEWLRQEFRN